MAGNGRVVKVPNGGYIEFSEPTVTGPNKGRLQTTNLNGDFVWTLPNKSCNLGGLGPGETYPVSAGGTGVGSIGFGQIPYGSGLEYLNLTAPPSQANTFLGWDGVALSYAPINIGPNGEVNTMQSVGSGAQVNRGKLGTELRLRSLTGGQGISVTQNLDEIQFDLNLASFGGIIPVNQGGTGINTIVVGDLLVGGPDNTLTRLPRPNIPNAVLRRNLANTGFEWVSKERLETGMIDVWSGQIEYPDTTITNHIHTSIPFRFRLLRIVHNTGAGNANITMRVSNTVVVDNQAIRQGGPEPFTINLPNTVFAAGSNITINFSSISAAESYRFSIVYERIATGD